MEANYRKPDIYLVCGKARHGKDTLSSYLKETYEQDGKKAIITYLGKYIKYYAREMTGWDLSEETKPRELLQQLGTEVIRKKLKKEHLFIDRLIEDIEIFSYFYDAIIISDARLVLEVTELKKAFPSLKVVHIVRPNFDNGLTEEQKNHPTETAFDNFDGFDIEIENTTLEKLKKDAENLYIKSKKEV